MTIKEFIRQNFSCKHSWHFTLAHLSNDGVPTAFGDYVIKAHCKFCGKKVKGKKKLLRILKEEGI